MLKTVDLTGKLDKRADCVMLIGGFDGLHAGHKKLLARAKSFSLPVGIMTIVGGKDGKSLFTASERETIFKAAGIDFVFELPFAEIRDMTGEAFSGLLCEEFTPKAFVCGDDFRFGKGAVGTPETLKRATHVRVEVEKLLLVDGEKVSSSTVKKLLSGGEIERANRLLADEFFLTGKVIKDREVGRTMGFPTANILYPEGKYPVKKGVYETRVDLGGRTYKAITNYGARPTFDNDRVLTETYLDGFCGDLYGRTLTVRFVRFLREIKKFEDADALKAQLQEDIRRVRSDD